MPDGAIERTEGSSELRGLEQVTRQRPVFFEYTLIAGVNDSPEDARRFAEMISRQVVRLQRIVQDLLDLAALESGSLDTQLENVQAGPFCENLLGMVEDMAHVRDVELDCKLSDTETDFGRSVVEGFHGQVFDLIYHP